MVSSSVYCSVDLFFFIQKDIQMSKHHLKISFLPGLRCHFHPTWVFLGVCAYFLSFSFIPLCKKFTVLIINHFTILSFYFYHSKKYLVELVTFPILTPLFFPVFLTIISCLFFHMNFVIILQKKSWCFYWDSSYLHKLAYRELITLWCWPPIQEHGLSFHLLKRTYISFRSGFLTGFVHFWLSLFLGIWITYLVAIINVIFSYTL